ncbi:hypothetical protein BVC80_9047g17 [Macleaya cordata]|uniref:Late embryogenesis abundant protein n=1 Tax=Macleaya cordata TaxID=56857 RepID=A0A200R2X4_MACCD|nr:hypothetical protein BVC80_9047g17 [Macleaya cordata]
MSRFGSAKTKALLFRSCREAKKKGERTSFRNVMAIDQMNEIFRDNSIKDNDDDEEEKKVNMSWWIPHPRTGIYYPKGHEWVMEDLPDGAASFRQTYWLRNAEGVDKPSPDANSLDHPIL